MKLGEKLKFLRENSKFSQTEVAMHLGIDQTMLSRIESGERTTTLGVLKKLSELFLCSLESLLDENMKPNVTAVPFRSKDATSDDFCQISKANKIILNLKEMIELRDRE